MVVFSTSYDEWSAMVKIGDECQLTANMSLHGNLCYVGLLRRSFVPVKFLLVSFNLSDEHETYNALVVVWSGIRSHAAHREARHLTRHSLSAHS